MMLPKSAALVGAGLGLLGCQPTPDYRITVRDIPADAKVLLVGWKSEGDRVARTSLAVPIADLGPEERQSYVISLDVGETEEGAGVVSLATVGQFGADLCITSVVSSELLPRSSSTRVTQLDIELDPGLNENVVQRATAPNPPVACPAGTMYPWQLPYPPFTPCARLPGLGAIPTEPTRVPTRPVVINTLRQLRGQARVFDGGKLTFFGWGFDRAALAFGIVCDPTGCFPKLAMRYPEYANRMFMPFRYPDLVLVSYSQLELPVAKVKSALNVNPASGFQDGMILCIAESTTSFTLTNPDGAQASFSEPLPNL